MSAPRRPDDGSNPFRLVGRLPGVDDEVGAGQDLYDVATGRVPLLKALVRSGAGLGGGALGAGVATGIFGWGALGIALAGGCAAFAASEVAAWLWDRRPLPD